MNADWKNSLSSLLESGILPEGQDTPQPEPKPEPWPRLSVSLDRRKGGKLATIVTGFAPDDPRCQELASLLKKKLAVGGSTRDGEILIQGDRVAQVKAIIKETSK